MYAVVRAIVNWAHSAVVARPLCKRKAPGSIPGVSKLLISSAHNAGRCTYAVQLCIAYTLTFLTSCAIPHHSHIFHRMRKRRTYLSLWCCTGGTLRLEGCVQGGCRWLFLCVSEYIERIVRCGCAVVCVGSMHDRWQVDNGAWRVVYDVTRSPRRTHKVRLHFGICLSPRRLRWCVDMVCV